MRALGGAILSQVDHTSCRSDSASKPRRSESTRQRRAARFRGSPIESRPARVGAAAAGSTNQRLLDGSPGRVLSTGMSVLADRYRFRYPSATRILGTRPFRAAGFPARIALAMK